MKHRFFIAPMGSPLHAEIARLTSERESGFRAMKAFTKDEGCSKVYGSSPATYLFDFKTMDEVDQRKWSQVKRKKGRGVTEILFQPKRNTPEGKELLARVKALPNFPLLESAINIVPGLSHGLPMCFDGFHGYCAFIRFYSPTTGLLVISVPSPEVEAKKLKAYAKQAASSKRNTFDSTMDAALWAPPEWLPEVKEWEAMKAIDQNDAAVVSS